MPSNGLTRQSLQTLQRMLVAGIGALWLTIGILFWISTIPLLPEAPAPDAVAVGVTATLQLVAWLWARRRVPRPRPMMSLPDFWKQEATTTAAALPLFLFEGSAMLAAVWTLLTASPATAVMSALGVIGLLMSGPAAYEEPDL